MAVITTEGRAELTALYVAMFGVAPGSTSLSEMVQAAEGGKTLLQIATDLSAKAGFGANFPGFMTGQEFADALVADMLPASTPAAAKAWATSWVIGALNAGKSRAQVISEAVQGIRATTNTNYTDAKAELANEVEVSLYYAITKGAAADSAVALNGVNATAASVTAAKNAIDVMPISGAHSALTTSTDALVGDGGNNTFNGTATTLTAGDKIEGGAGTDRLVLTATGTTPSFTLTSVETVDLTASPNPATVNLVGSTGITSINNLSSANGATVTVNNVGNVVNTTITGGNSATTIGYTTAAVSGTADASTLTLAGTAAGSSFTANGVETITVASTTSANTLTSLTDDKLSKLVVTGDKDLTITNAVGGTTIATIDASAATGAVKVVTGAGAGGTSLTGITVTGPTTTGSIDVTTGANKDTVTLGSGNNTVNTGAGADTITSGAGTNTITPGAGNDIITLSGGKDTLRYADAGPTNADTVTGLNSNTIIALNLGAAQAGTTLATAGTFGVVQTGATSPVLPGVGGTGTATAISYQAVNPGATATSGTVLAASNVLSLNGAFTDGTAAGVVAALGTTATTGIATTTNGKFVLVTYSVGNIAQVWSYAGDTTSNGDIDAAELNLVATLNGVAQNSITAANFTSYLTPATTTGTIDNVGQTITLNQPLNTVQSSPNANGQYLTAANDTVTVGVGMLPTAAATATSGLTVIDPSSTDADVLSATVLAAGWNLGTIIAGIETVNLNMLASDTDGFIQSAVLPGTTTLNVTGGGNLTVSDGVLSGNAYGLGAGYTGTLAVAVPTNPTAALTLNLNGTVGTSAATSPGFDITGGVVTALTVNANANTTLKMDLNTTEAATVTLNGAGNVTVFGTSANFGAANVNAVSPAYTGTLTFRPSDAASLDFSATGVVNGLKGLDYSDVAAAAVTALTFTQPAATGGNTLTFTDAPTTARATAIKDLTVVQQGGTLNDTVNFVFGDKISASTAGTTLVAAQTENVNISFSPTTAGTALTYTAVTTAVAIGTQTVKVSGTAAFTLGTVTADALDASGVASTGSISATLANGATGGIFTGGAGTSTIVGSTVADSFTGGAGNDSLRAQATGTAAAAADRMTGAAGNDTYILSGDSAQAAVAVATAYALVPNVTDFSASGANGVDILGLSATIGNYAGGSAFPAGVAAAAAGSTAIQSVAKDAAAAAYVAGTDLIKLTTSTAATGTLQTLFNDAIGTATVTALTANGDDIFFTVYDSTNSKVVVGLVNTGADAIVGTGDVVTLIGTLDMTAANYALLTNANLQIVAA